MEKRLTPSSRRFMIILAVFGLWIMAIGATAGMLGLLFALALVAAFGAMLLPGAAWLQMDPEGFTVRNFYRDERFRWVDIKEFKVMTYRYMGFIPIYRSVAFTFSEHYPKRNLLLRVASKLAAFDRKLPDNYGMKAQELAKMLEAARLRAVGNYPVLPSPVEPW